MIFFTFPKDMVLLKALKGHVEEETNLSKPFSFLSVVSVPGEGGP